ncbi:uncharacterized protein LOC120090026 [Benincasa hispida]|uniref:uncharacterized protein LOC120090026 n=1 Tax=Benincasa hispida TaxID=102211 RepID=UPI0019022120|nr:uncharacterized protein LOC120090026 [Benincasa hispida]
MALPSNRSSSPAMLSGRTSPNSRNSEISNPVRRSFSGNPFSKPSIVANPRGLNPITPANSPSDYPRRNSVSRENSFTSRNIQEKENEKDQSPKPVRVRSPMVGKSSKHFMSPTISAASKIAASPKKKILGDQNEPVRSSNSFSGMKSSSLNSVNQSSQSSKTLESDTNPQIPPVSSSKSTKTVRFGGFEVISDSHDDSETTYRYDLNPEVVATMAVEADMKSEMAPVSKSASAVAPLESSNSDFEVISISNKDLDSPPARSNLIEDVDCVNLDPSFKISPISSPMIAPLDDDPSIPPYDPKTNYLSPRPQFLHYRPNRRINRYEPEGRLEEKLFSFANVSQSESMEETDSEDSPKESDEASSNESEMEEEEQEEEEINVSEQSPTEMKQSSKLHFSSIFKTSSLLLILFTACFSICVVNVHDPNIFQRPSSLTMEDESEIFGFAKTNFNVLVGKLEVWHVKSISFISDVVFNFRGGLPLIHYENQTEFFNEYFNMNEQCLVLSHQTVWEEENNLNVIEAMKDREIDIFEEPIEKECQNKEEEQEAEELPREIGIETDERESEIVEEEELFQEIEAMKVREEQEQEQEDVLQEIEAIKMREIFVENVERESQNEEELEDVSFQETEANANEEENDEAFQESLQETIEESENSASDKLTEEEYVQEKPEENFKFSSLSDLKFHDQIEQAAAAATGETEEEKNTEFQYQLPPVSPPAAEHQSDFEEKNGGKIIDLIRTKNGISQDFTQNTAIIISAILLGTLIIGLIYARQSGSKPSSSMAAIAEEEEEKQPLVKEEKMNQSLVEEEEVVEEEGHEEEDDMGGEFCSSETSSFQYSSMREEDTKAGKRSSEVQSHSHGRKKMRKNSRRESMASSSLDEYSVSTSASPSYGSFTTYEKIPIKHGKGDDEIVTPVRRSTRIRKQHNNS